MRRWGLGLRPRRKDLERIDRDTSLLIQEHLPGPEYSLATFATSDGRVMAVIPLAQSKVESGDGCAVSDETLKAVGCRVAKRIGLTSVRISS
jgi:carbamoyl-phosphate synthase large subunit